MDQRKRLCAQQILEAAASLNFDAVNEFSYLSASLVRRKPEDYSKIQRAPLKRYLLLKAK